jgi:UDP-glucose 4-epimerase
VLGVRHVPTRVLVTGGAGFIGSHVVDALLAGGSAVTVLDDLSTGRAENLPAHERLRVVVGDAADAAAVEAAIDGCSTVVHLAAVASVQRSVEDPVGTHRANYVATLQVTEAARARGVRRIVYASSAAVYGDAQTPPVTERGATSPQSPYAIDKLMGEAYLAFCGRAFGLSGVALRFFNVYGPRQPADSPYSGVISRFVAQAQANEPVTIFGDGRQTRDFVYVGDLVRTIVTCASEEDLALAGPLNVGTGTACSLLELLDAVEAATGARLERRVAPARPGEVRHSTADVTALRSAIGWVPDTPISEGLARMLSIPR